MSSTDGIIKDFPRADKLNLTHKNPTVQDIKKGPIASLLTSVKRKYTEISISSKLSLDTNGTSKYNITSEDNYFQDNNDEMSDFYLDNNDDISEICFDQSFDSSSNLKKNEFKEDDNESSSNNSILILKNDEINEVEHEFISKEQ